MRRHGVRCLLMGGQACVFYGAAEFSRDADFAVLAEAENLARLGHALDELGAGVIAVPAFEADYLQRGHAIHFRCGAPGVEGFRIYVMSVMRGVEPFDVLWNRRTTVMIEEENVELLSLPDLVRAKKTQRAKDWPMVRRLIEAHWFQNRDNPTAGRVDFWLRECQSVGLLLEIAAAFPERAREFQALRPVLRAALAADPAGTEAGIEAERVGEIAADKAYWEPLRRELERLRHEK